MLAYNNCDFKYNLQSSQYQDSKKSISGLKSELVDAKIVQELGMANIC
jgi:hypothetical protein